MKIGELARRADVPIDTVRYYERQGLLLEEIPLTVFCSTRVLSLVRGRHRTRRRIRGMGAPRRPPACMGSGSALAAALT